MVNANEHKLAGALVDWIGAEPVIRSAVLFGSKVHDESEIRDDWSDFDLHLVVSDADKLETFDWAAAMPDEIFCMAVTRPATGGVRKVTAVFANGQIDLVLVPETQMQIASLAMGLGLHRRWRSLRRALNEMSTCLTNGYRFLKGEKRWGGFYAQVARVMPGVRMGDAEIRQFADGFLCELLWLLLKLERGELVAAQVALHRSLAETNFRLVRELRLRRGESLPSFGLARRVEMLLRSDELGRISVNAGLNNEALRLAAWHSFDALIALMRELVPSWSVPAAMQALLARHAPTSAK